MKQFNDDRDLFNEVDFDSVSEDIDLYCGDRLGVRNVIFSRVDANIPRYSEMPVSAPLENEDEVKEINDRVRLPGSGAKAGRFIH